MKARFSSNDWQLTDLVSFAMALGVSAIVVAMIVIHAIVGFIAFGALWAWLARRTATAWLGWVELERDGQRWKVREGVGGWCWRRHEFDAAAVLDVRVAFHRPRNGMPETRVVRVLLSTLGTRQNELVLGRGMSLGDGFRKLVEMLTPSTQPPAVRPDKTSHE